MAVTATPYNNGLGEILKGNIAPESDDIKVALLDSAYTPDDSTDIYWDDISANEISGTGYTAGGVSLTTPSVTVNNTDNQAEFSADDAVWDPSTITAGFAVAYKDTGDPATSPLLGRVDFGGDKSSNDNEFRVKWDGGIVMKLSK